MDELKIPVSQAETFFIQVLRMKEKSPQKTAIAQYGLKKFDPLDPRETESEQGYFEADVYDVINSAFKLPFLKCENCSKQLIELQPVVYFLEGEIMILALHATLLTNEITYLGDWLRFVEAFRWVHLRKFQELTWRDKYVKPIEPYPAWLNNASSEQTARMIISQVFRAAFGKEMNIQSESLFKNYGKLFVSNFMDLESTISRENFYHILFVDRPEGHSGYSDPLPSPEIVEQELLNNTYKRWIHQNQYFGFTGYSFCFVLTPHEGRQISFTTEKFQSDYRIRYHILYIIALLELSVQNRFINELNQGLRKAKTQKMEEMKFSDQISNLRKELLLVNTQTWFGRITNETQPRELFNLARLVLGTDKLHNEILQKLSELDEHMNTRLQANLSKRMDLLQRILTPLIAITAAFSLFQIPVFQDFFFNIFDRVGLSHLCGSVLTISLITFSVSILINRFVWRDAYKNQ